MNTCIHVIYGIKVHRRVFVLFVMFSLFLVFVHSLTELTLQLHGHMK